MRARGDWRCTLFGHRFASNVPLLAGDRRAREGEPRADVSVVLGPFDECPAALLALPWQPYPEAQTDEPGYRVSIATTGGFHWFRLGFTSANSRRMTYFVHGAGDQIWTGWEYPAGRRSQAVHAARSLFHSRVLNVVLRLRGLLCLHGAALTCDGAALGVVGAMQAGKSTLAAALLRAGCRLLADDRVAVREDGDKWMASPGTRDLRLWSDTLGHFGHAPATLTRVLRRNDKRILPIDHLAAEAPAPLRALYLLGARDDERVAPSITPLRPAEALFHLIEHRLGAMATGSLQEDTLRLRNLAERVPLKRLHRSHSLDDLAATADALVTDFRLESSAQPAVT